MQRAAQRGSSLNTVSTPAPDPAGVTTLTKLWLLGIGAWGHRWVSSLGELPVDDRGQLTTAGALWSRQLAGLPEADLIDAVQHAAGRLDWPPSLAELRKRALGIPPFDAVAADIGRMQHRFTRLVWRHLDHWKFTRADGRAAERMLRAAYALAEEQRMAGEPLPQPPVALVEHRKPHHVPANPETARKHIEALRSRLHLDPGDVAAEGLPALELSPAEQVEELRANCIASGLNPEAMALQVEASTWEAIRAEVTSAAGLRTHQNGGAHGLFFEGFPVRVVKLIPGGKSMQLVRA